MPGAGREQIGTIPLPLRVSESELHSPLRTVGASVSLVHFPSFPHLFTVKEVHVVPAKNHLVGQCSFERDTPSAASAEAIVEGSPSRQEWPMA